MKHTLTAFLITSIVVSLISVPARAEGVINGSFEQADGNKPAGWHNRIWDGRARFSHDTNGHKSARSVKISSENNTDAGWIVYQEVQPFSRYKLSCWIKTENVVPANGRGALLCVEGYRGSCTPAVTGTVDWTYREMEFDTEANDAIQINLMLGYYGRVKGTAWYDGITCELISSHEMKPEAVIEADTNREPISPYIYGQFIEHLGRCIYGGIWAEMLQDRKFYYAVGTPGSPWRVSGSPNTVGMTTNAPYVGDHDPEITAQSGKPSGLTQNELGLEKGRNYVGYIILSGPTSAAPVSVSLVWGETEQDRQTLNIPCPGAEYSRVPLAFYSEADTDNGALAITVGGTGTVRIGTVSLMPTDNIKGFRADTLALLKELDSPVYRWPGGNFVSGYDWRDGIGPRDKRPPRKNPAWRGVEHNDVGIHEFIELCRLLDTEPYIAVNTGKGTIDSAAEEVEYVNGATNTPMGALRAGNGILLPFDVRWWGVGNEMFGGWQIGHMPLEEYVKKHNAVAKAMWAKDPSIQLIAVGAVGRWDELMMKYCADFMNYISEHFYCQERPGVSGHVRLIPDAIKRICDAHRSYRETIPELKGKDIRIAMDEWNYWYGPHVYGELGTRYFLKDALGIAAGLHEYFRNSDIVYMANYAQTVNVIGCIKTSKTRAAFATTGLVLKLYRAHFGSLPLAIGGDTLPLDVSAALDNEREHLTVAIVNSMNSPQNITLNTEAFSLTGTGTLWRIAGTDPMAYNEPGKEPNVAIEELPVNSFGPELAVPPLSVSLFKMQLQ